MPKMRAVQVPAAKGPFQLMEREVPEPNAGSVRIKVQACGICHSDEYAKEGSRPGITYPRVPGHEIAGVIDAVGPNVLGWEIGQRVGVGWHGGHCGYCDSCRRGDFVTCSKGRQITGLTCDGGYADFVIISAAALARIPDGLSATDAAPLLCAGVTTFNALRNSGARTGNVVAILGLGGLGHLGVQFAATMGFETVAIARGKEKEPFAKKLGAKHYLDSESQNVAAELEKMGGAKVILSTVTSGKAVNAVLGGMGINGKTILVGNPDQPLEITGRLLIAGRRSISGWPSGSPIDSQDTLAFCSQTGVRPMIEIFPLERAAEAYERMLSGKARFRVVLSTGL
ncbi:MAG TPA: alcohol dehydrogenase [Verrucomicrobiae bacterium]|nr:alcohol dehydrogenase [Verrucomicrobiae bacterium]